jgi:RecB family exonuclease
LSIASPDGAEVVRVRGSIDRVDELPGGGQLVLDYKSGGIEGARRKLRKETLLAPEFQLALYAAAVAQARPAAQVDAAYVSINGAARTRSLRDSARKAGVDPDALLALDPAERRRLRAQTPPPLNLADRVWDRVSAMRAGRFPIAPITCEHCDLGAVCRIVALPVEDDE